MEPETRTTSQEKDLNEDRMARDSPSTTGEKADQDQQIIIGERNMHWYKTTLAFDYLQPAFVPIVKDVMKSLQEQSIIDFGRQLCAEATTEDIIRAHPNIAQFRHMCPMTVITCQGLLSIIKGHTQDSVHFYEMLKDTDPQNWLTSPFEFARLFLKDWMRCNIQDFSECDITAICSMVMRCKPLMQIFAGTNMDKVRMVRNRTMHRARMNISKQEMEENIDVILDFLQHIKALKNTDDVTKAIELIKQLRTGDVRLLHDMVVQLIQGWLTGARREFAHKSDVANDLHQNILYLENELDRLTSGQETATKIGKGEEHTSEAKIEKLTDENQILKQTNEDMIKLIEKLTDENQTLKQTNEDMIKLPEDKLDLKNQDEQLTKRLERQQEEMRELEKQKEELRKHLVYVNVQVKKCPTNAFPDMKRSEFEHIGAKHFSSPANSCTDVSWLLIQSAEDKNQCYITGMLAIRGAQLILIDKDNSCIKVLDLGHRKLVNRKELPSFPRDVTFVPDSRVAVSLPGIEKVYFFTADQYLKPCGNINVAGYCISIHCIGDKLFVSYLHPAKIQILDMDGKIINTMQHNSSGVELFRSPMYLTCSLEHQCIYVSDTRNHTVTCMDMAGLDRWKYTKQSFPQGVCTGDMSIYICGYKSIHVLSPGGAILAVIPYSQTGIECAQAVCYSRQDRTLYVSCFEDDPHHGAYITRLRIQ